MTPSLRTHLPRPRRLLTAIGAAGLALLSCGREVTGPGEGMRFATGLSFVAEFPAPLASVAAGAGLEFDKFGSKFSDVDHLVSFGAHATAQQVLTAMRCLSAGGRCSKELLLRI